MEYDSNSVRTTCSTREREKQNRAKIKGSLPTWRGPSKAEPISSSARHGASRTGREAVRPKCAKQPELAEPKGLSVSRARVIGSRDSAHMECDSNSVRTTCSTRERREKRKRAKIKGSLPTWRGPSRAEQSSSSARHGASRTGREAARPRCAKQPESAEARGHSVSRARVHWLQGLSPHGVRFEFGTYYL